jgi:UDP-N-acetylmuramoyl-L-alanyl-D-glutamate--2,6-diaminopimelate ligase
MEKIEKKLSQLLTAVFPNNDYQVVAGKTDGCIISSLVYDSRAVKPGSLYFAWPGVHVHGNTYIAKAVASGASAVVFQDDLPVDVLRDLDAVRESTAYDAGGSAVACAKRDVPLIKVADSRFAMAPFAASFYDNPSKKMAVIGVTGTEGKSTTVFLIWQFLRLCGKKAGFFSTVQYSLGGDAVNNPEHQTTPEATVVQEKLYQMAVNGCEFAVVESSSHGLSKKLNRLGSVCFDVGIMMNVTSEHLEFHGTYEQYKSDKANLFRALDECDHVKTILGKEIKVPSFGIVKAADPAAGYFADCTKKPVYGFAMETDSLADTAPASGKLEGFFVADGIKSDSEGEFFNLHGNCADSATKTGVTFYVDNCYNIGDIRINLPGTFNVYNATAAMLAVSGILGVTITSLKDAAAKLLPVKGRMTVVDCGQPFEVIVDYAHTPSSFMTIFPPLRERLEREAAARAAETGAGNSTSGTNGAETGAGMSAKRGRLIALFGSGGERDTKKRPEQGRIASEYCDIVILADEDPRGEDPMALLEDIAAGCKNSRRNENLFLIPDRPTAIAKAFSLAAPGDIVLLLGKAHENSIIYKDYVMPYDEILEAEKQLKKLITR